MRGREKTHLFSTPTLECWQHVHVVCAAPKLAGAVLTALAIELASLLLWCVAGVEREREECVCVCVCTRAPL